jgi:hypothetical protein
MSGTMYDKKFLKYLDEPLMTSLAKPKKFGQEPWRDLKIPQALIVVGDKRSGKDVVLDDELITLYKNGFTCIKIFDGGGHESLYYEVKKNYCKVSDNPILKPRRLFRVLNYFEDIFFSN